ncbi:phosphoglycerate mutase [Lineolata rhizophorae]|uniref:Phosphoglycerate mutase n=1 Tax=Lineolata rhizophorae TaxID=578093 RepID=A0A6A6PEV1_9PEZI|nr:phosphoglycerate mutase [Lineolata rhizophorae]
MADKDSATPRVFLFRHGETEWTKSGQYTGRTDISLTPHGAKQVKATGRMVVGRGKLIDPDKLGLVFCSPRIRAQTTFKLAVGDDEVHKLSAAGKVDITEKIAEWNYGAYEGLLTHEIRMLRAAHGLDSDRPWDIWRDGCEEGESAKDVTQRLDDLISRIHELQKDNMHGEKNCDVALFAHGHILRAFVKRWLKYPLEFRLSMMLEPGGVGVLSYQHQNVEEPAVLVGIGFPLSE